MGKKNKSKAPKGRAAAKQKAKKGGSGGTWTADAFRNAGRAQYGWSDDDDDAMTSTHFRGFTQTQNSSNAPRNLSLRSATVKLRHQAITFVSAGTNTPDEFLPKKEVFVADEDSEEDEPESPEEDIDESTLQSNIVMETEIDMSEMKFVVDTVGDPSLATELSSKGKQQAIRSPSPTPSNSSEEIVIFQGRNNAAPTANQPTRTKYKEVLTPAFDGGYDAHTTQQSSARIESQAEQIAAAQEIMNRPKAAAIQQQSMPYPRPQTTRSSSQQYRPPQSQPQPAVQEAIGWGARQATFQTEVAPDATWAPAPAGSWWKNKSKKLRPDLDISDAEKMAIDEKPRSKGKVMFIEPKANEEDAAAEPKETASKDHSAEEIISTLQAEVRSMQKCKRRARQASREQNEVGSKASTTTSSKRRGKRGRKKENRQLRDPIEGDDSDGDDSDAAFEDYMANLAAQQVDGPVNDVFGSTAHSSGLGPSLFVDGQAIDDNDVLPSHLNMMNNSDSENEDEGPIGLDTSELSSSEESDDLDLSNLESTELEDELEYTLQEQWEDEEDLRQRRQERMTDEQVARLYAKQQELGIDGDELIIDNGEYGSMSEDIDGIGDIARARAGFANISNISFGKSNKRGMRRRSNRGAADFSFPDASALADTVEQYGENGFDIMNLDRPSLRPTKKRRKGNLPPELEALSDEDLKDNMRTAWANDRRKKSAKKAEREELRMQGLLGAAGRAGKADLSEKYQFGMTKVQIHEELRIFLENENQQSRPFPPMGKNDRKELHEIASVLKLGSKSIGSGKDRYPVLTKTSRTRYSPDILSRAIDASSKGFLGHGSKTARKLSRQGTKAAKGGFGSTGAAQLRNGEVVGASAAELGKENFGHRLMEKMGWSKGMALGKEGEGRLEPVEQKVRLGTAGLG